MATLKSETGSDALGFVGWTLYAMAGLCFGLAAFEFIGIRLPVSDAPGLRLLEILAYSAIGCAMLHLILTVAYAFVRTLSVTLLGGLEIVLGFAERLGTMLAQATVRLLLVLARLALVPVVLPWRIFQARVLAPWQERRRQMAELHRLYADVKDQYRDFEDFLHAFNDEVRESADTQDDAMQETEPAPIDGFVAAAALFGLAADGSFTKADFKTAYRKRMKEAHPDLSGDAALATKLNEARDLINARKGWKR
jgi:hypothetical protein